DFGKYTDIPESGITNRGAINNLLNGIYSTSGVLVSGVTQAKINMVRELILDKIPMDDNYQYASAYWANFLTPFLNKASAEVEQIDQATTVVNSLFDSNQQPKLTNTQEQINAAKTKVNALPESSAKTALLEKVATAQQAFEAVKNEAGKVQLATEAVNALFNGLVPKLTNTQEQIDAAKAKVNALANSDVKTALLARIASAQKVFDASVEAAKQATEQIRNDLNALYFRNNGNIDKTGLSREATQSAFDALQQRIDALSINAPAMNQQKQALQTQLNDMKAMLQEIQLKASSGQVVAQLDSNPKGTYIRTFAGTVPGNATIGKIQITEPKYNSFIYLFNKEYQGGTYQNTVSNLIETTGRKRGKLIITTNEMPLAVNGNIQLSNTVSKEYTFKLNSNGKWELS
ncbi:toxin Cry1Ac domain D-VI-related protein, partial [Enterococcus ratti]|uniref:toxin Cry1Ac domain D-VI-related protein n=1 Tax=Enterococcus ratti TaxID=150033 RepID=UPI003513C402